MITVGAQVIFKLPGLKFPRVLEGSVISIDAAGEKAIVACNDDTVATVAVSELSLAGDRILRAPAAAGSFMSKAGF